jgi:anti-sigma B factor antagonist
MQRDFLVDTQTSGRMVIVALSGELDLLSSPVLGRALECLPADADTIVVDLRGLEFMDSTGLHLLIRAQQDAQEAGRRFALVRGGDQVQRLLNLTGVADAVTIVDSADELLEIDHAPGAPGLRP